MDDGDALRASTGERLIEKRDTRRSSNEAAVTLAADASKHVGQNSDNGRLPTSTARPGTLLVVLEEASDWQGPEKARFSSLHQRHLRRGGEAGMVASDDNAGSGREVLSCGLCSLLLLSAYSYVTSVW